MLKKRKSFKQTFAELAIGETITGEFSTRQAPYHFAKLAGVSIVTLLSRKQPAKGFRVQVTRVDPDNVPNVRSEGQKRGYARKNAV